MPVIFNEPADPVNYKLIELVQRGHVVGNNALNIPCFNVFHFRRLSGSTPGNVSGLIGNVGSALNAALNAALPAGYVSDEVGGRPLDDESIPETVVTPGWGAAAAVAGDDIPTMNAASFQLVTDGRGRCFRGRKHIGPVAESHTDMNVLNGTGLPLWQAVGAAILTLAAGIDDSLGNIYGLVVLSRKNSIIVGTGINFTTATVIDVITNEVVGSMDRRKERRAP
jgi:hypothetical protein